MDRQYLKTPFYGSRKMKAWLLQQGYLVSRKRVRRLMRLGIVALHVPLPGLHDAAWNSGPSLADVVMVSGLRVASSGLVTRA